MVKRVYSEELTEGATAQHLRAHDPGEGRKDTQRGKILEEAARNGMQGSSHHFGLRKKQCWFIHSNRRKEHIVQRQIGGRM